VASFAFVSSRVRLFQQDFEIDFDYICAEAEADVC